MVYTVINLHIEGSLEVKLPTIWTDEKQRWEESQKRRRKKIKEEKFRRKKIHARKGRKVAFGALLEVVMSKKCAPLWREAHFQECPKHTMLGALLEVEMSKKVHAVVARSTFPSQNVQSTPASEHFWKLRCRKSARRCGAKHVSKSKS